MKKGTDKMIREYLANIGRKGAKLALEVRQSNAF